MRSVAETGPATGPASLAGPNGRKEKDEKDRKDKEEKTGRTRRIRMRGCRRTSKLLDLFLVFCGGALRCGRRA